MSKELTEKRQNGFRQVVCGDFVDRKFFDDILSEYRKATNYLENQVQRLQEQLKEANEAIKTIRKTVKEGEFPCDACGYSMACDGCWCGDIADDYLEKWGVK